MRTALLPLGCALALLAAGCSLAGDDETSEGATPQAAPVPKHFAELKVIFDESLDNLDPQLSYTTEGWQALRSVYLPLLSYRHEAGREGATLMPALASSLPVVSDGGRRYRLTLRKGLRYSNGTPVRAADFAYALRRLRELSSPGADLFANVEHVAAGANGSIEIRLRRPQAGFEDVLALPFGAPVPTGSTLEDASATPLPATGPYRLIRPPGGGFALVRNLYWKPIPGIPSGYAKRISVEVTGDAAAAFAATWSGVVDYTTHQIPLPEVEQVLAAHGDRIRRGTPGNTYYAFLNVNEPPFDRLAVRKAVELAIDRRAFVARFGGLASPTQNVLPPGYPAYRKLDLYEYDPARARRELAKAGAAGAPVTVWTSDRESYRSLAAVLVAQLDKVGLKADLKVLDDAIYFTAVANPTGHAQIGIANWLQDYVHPVNWFGELLTGEANERSPDQNLANADVPALNELVGRLSRQPTLTAAGNAGWARADRIALEQALWIPLLNRQFTDAFGPRVDLRCTVGHVLYGLDLARLCLSPSNG